MPSILERAYGAEEFRDAGHALVDALADYLDLVKRRVPEKAIEWVEPETATRAWEERLKEGASPLALFESVLADSVKLHHPRYMGHQISPAAPVAALAGMLNDFINNGMGVYEMGVAGTAMERAVLASVARKMGFGESAGGMLTSGGTLANVTALLAARSIKAKTHVWKEGGAAPLALLVSEEAHYCVDRAVRIMGWGEGGIIKVPCDQRFALRTELLEPLYRQALAQGKEVIAVVGSACSTSTGSFDDLEAIGAFAEAHGLWFHVDGAHGAACVYAPGYRHLLRGLERADSVTMDFHKMLLTPSLTTALVFKREKDSFRTFAQKAEYLLDQAGDEDWYNLAKRTFECTKTMMSLRAYTLLQQYGEGLFEEYITKVNDLCAAFADILESRPHWQIATRPSCNILCFRYVPSEVPEESHNALNAQIRVDLLHEGRFYIVQTQLRGKIWLRVTLTNPFTTIEDLKELITHIEERAPVKIHRTT